MQTTHRQKGLALLMLVFVLALVAIAYAVNKLDSSELQNERDRRTTAALAEAKAALIGWSISHLIQPGVMPFPDRRADGNYDGNSDCTPTAPGFNLLIGRLPFLGQSAPCAAAANGLATNLTDGSGEQLWYAVSKNLIRTSFVPIINPSIVDAPPEDWLVVRDENGQTISDRVAVVIIAPGSAIGAQDRSGLAGENNYLDTFGTYSNSDYDSANEDFFIINEEGRFNDQLIFITIDELMTALEKRVAQEVISNLNNYFETSALLPEDRFYPYAADSDNNCIDGLLAGALALKSACISTPMLTGLPPWLVQNGWEGFLYYALSPDCSNNGPDRGCKTAVITSGVELNINAILIATGTTLSQTELVPTYSQNRPSNDIRDYLDSLENTNGDYVYDAKSKLKTNIYNDQLFILTP